VVAAAQYSIRIGHVMKGNPNIARATPKEGVVATPYDLCVTKASPNQDVSRRYINFALSPKIQESLAANLLATPVHRSVKVPPAAQRLVMTDTSRLVFIDEDHVAAQQKEWVDRWVREVQGLSPCRLPFGGRGQGEGQSVRPPHPPSPSHRRKKER